MVVVVSSLIADNCSIFLNIIQVSSLFVQSGHLPQGDNLR